MDQKKFEQLLTEVCEWQKVAYSSDDKWKHKSSVKPNEPTFVKINRHLDRPCPYLADHNNCDIQIKRIDHIKPSFYLKHCRRCRHVIHQDRAYDTKGLVNVVYFYKKIIEQNK